MLGVADMNLSRASGDKITQIMQSPNHGPQAVRAAAALRATPPLVVAALSGDLGFRQILDARDALRGVRDIPSWSRHDDILHNLSALEIVGVSGSRSAEKLCNDATVSPNGIPSWAPRHDEDAASAAAIGPQFPNFPLLDGIIVAPKVLALGLYDQYPPIV